MSRQRASSASELTTGLLAGIGLAAFYSAGFALQSEFFQRYFCGHPLEYVSTAMFFIGMSILVIKYWRLKAESAALTTAESFRTADDAKQNLETWSNRLHKSFQATQIHRRIQETLQYLKGSRRAGLEEHLRYLAELASDRLHQTYATIRTITWAIPILGFLGTVIGITMAIANVTPEQLDTSLGTVTRGLSVAFDTTALALGMSIVLVFASFVVERSEQKILSDVEQFGIEVLLPWFGADAGSESDSARSPQNAALLSAHQPEVWAEQLAEIRSVWTDVLQRHAVDLGEAINAELQQTLQLHREGCADARDVYASALQQSSEAIVDRVDRIVTVFEERVSAWQGALQVSSQASAQQSEALHELGATLLRLTESGSEIAHLQQQLNENLQALQVAETMERTANSLTAAVHVLTAKTSARQVA